jgi:hypothetical protein
MEKSPKILFPRCHPYWIVNGEKIENNEEILGQKLAYTATGHILPCCWLDNNNKDPKQKVQQFLTDELKLENNDSIEDIITSDTWINFHKSLIDFPENAPRMCQKMCKHNPTKGRVRNLRNAPI